MTPSTRRIVVLGCLLVTAGAAVFLGVAGLMLDDHAVWLERSFRMRWAFRDVPARRGAILDRAGVPIVTDHADFALELDYTTFRREHPVGMAVSGASLLDPGRYAHAPDGASATAALHRLLELPVAALHADVSGRAKARDLRFYLYGLGARLLGVSRTEIARRLLPAIRAARAEPVWQTMGLDLAAADAGLRTWVEALAGLDAMLPEPGRLFSLLEEGRSAHVAQPGQLRVPRTLARGLPFELVAGLGAQAEAWPGLRPYPTVDRVADGVGERWPSLLSLLGEVTAFGAVEHLRDRDATTIDRAVGEVLDDAELARYLPEVEGLDEEAADRLERRAGSFVRWRLESGGRAGRSGVELAAEDLLAGQLGLRWVERDVHAREQRLYRSLDVAPGQDVHLTLDLRLQSILERVLDDHIRGNDTALVVLDARTGDVLAMGGRPMELLDERAEPPRLRTRRVSPAATWRTTGYLGSLAKPFVLLEQLAAERAGLPCADRRELSPCRGETDWVIPGTNKKLECDGTHGIAGTEPVPALARSCNTFFFQLAEGLGAEGLRRAYSRAGWYEAGSGGDHATYQATVPGISGLARSTFSMADHCDMQAGIGYGLQASALMVARAYAALATGALPYVGLVQELQRPAPVSLGVPEADLELVHAGLRDCVLSGTARDIEGLAALGVHGKTGTAEINTKGLNNAWFAGFVLAGNRRPTLAFAAVTYVVEKHGKESAKIVGDFLRGVLEHPDADLRRRWLEGLEER